jgi:LmbE family N-acetylglucosaminyl deacetylase
VIEPIIDEFQPTIVYTHHGGDLNVDHRIVHQAVLTACRPQPNACVKKILSFEVNSSTEWASTSMSSPFLPNYFIDISQYQGGKQQLLERYQQEMKHYPHTRSVEAISYLNKVRGSAMGIESAEAFMLIRAIH